MDRMTCARRDARKPAKCRRIAVAIAFSAILILKTSSALAQGIEEFQKHATIGGRLPVSVLMVGWTQDGADIQKLFDIVIAKANEVFGRLDWRNPRGEVARVNASAGAGPVQVSPEVFSAFQAAKKVSKWSKGAFDITYAGPGNYRDIKISKGKYTVELTKPGMKVYFDGIMEGFLADLMIRYLYTAGMRHAIVKVGSVFRGMGKTVNGPWKVQVQDDSGMFAKHALKLTVVDTGVATVSANQFRGVPIVDPRTRAQIRATCKGDVVVMKEAALAQGIAQAVFVLGPTEGLALLSKMGKGLIVDNNGQFIRSPGF